MMDAPEGADQLRARATMALSLAQAATTFPERTAHAAEGVLCALLAIDTRRRGTDRKKRG